MDGIPFKILVHGPVAPLLEWLSMRSGWKLQQELRDGVKALFEHSEQEAIATELRRMITDGLNVIEFSRQERRLEEAFVDLLRDGRAMKTAKTETPVGEKTL